MPIMLIFINEEEYNEKCTKYINFWVSQGNN